MSPRTRPQGRPTSPARAKGGGARPDDDLLNRQVADALRLGAEARNARAEATSIADTQANEQIRATLRALIAGGRP
jgi:hypothetical protein